MIQSFANSETEGLFSGGASRKFPPEICARAHRKLFAIDAAMRIDDLRIDDLRMPPGNRLHQLKGDHEGQYAISVNDQWRICFTFGDGNAQCVELCDYH